MFGLCMLCISGDPHLKDHESAIGSGQILAVNMRPCPVSHIECVGVEGGAANCTCRSRSAGLYVCLRREREVFSSAKNMHSASRLGGEGPHTM